MNISVLFALALGTASPIVWTGNAPNCYLDTTSHELTLNVFNNNTGSAQNVTPNWNYTHYWTQKVYGSSNNGPAWTTPFTPLYDQNLGIGYSGGGESVPAAKKRTDYVPYTRDEGYEQWYSDASPPDVVSRLRTWEYPGTKTYRLTDLVGGGEGGG